MQSKSTSTGTISYDPIVTKQFTAKPIVKPFQHAPQVRTLRNSNISYSMVNEPKSNHTVVKNLFRDTSSYLEICQPNQIPPIPKRIPDSNFNINFSNHPAKVKCSIFKNGKNNSPDVVLTISDNGNTIEIPSTKLSNLIAPNKFNIYRAIEESDIKIKDLDLLVAAIKKELHRKMSPLNLDR